MAGLHRANARARVGDDHAPMLDHDLRRAWPAIAGRGKLHTLVCPGPTRSGCGSSRATSPTALKARTEAKEQQIDAFECGEHRWRARGEAQRRNSGIARHIAANAVAPDSKLPSSLAWKRASIAAGSIGHDASFACVTSTNSITRVDQAPQHPISRRHKGQLPSCQTISVVIDRIWDRRGRSHYARQNISDGRFDGNAAAGGAPLR